MKDLGIPLLRLRLMK